MMQNYPYNLVGGQNVVNPNMMYDPMAIYQERMNRLQNQFNQQFQQHNGNGIYNISGKFVNDFSEIAANDVPMDNIGAYFVKYDKSEICQKTWNTKTGRMETMIYRPVSDIVDNSEVQKDTAISDNGGFLEKVMNRLDDLSLKMEQLEKTLLTVPTVTVKSNATLKSKENGGKKINEQNERDKSETI